MVFDFILKHKGSKAFKNFSDDDILLDVTNDIRNNRAFIFGKESVTGYLSWCFNRPKIVHIKQLISTEPLAYVAKFMQDCFAGFCIVSFYRHNRVRFFSMKDITTRVIKFYG